VGAQDLVYKEVLLLELIENVLVGFQEKLSAKNIRFTEDLKVIKPFYSYAALVKVAIENVLENAIQFCGIQNQVIKINARQTADHAALVIEDNGQGIAEEYQDPI
jgi:signal transduction histidine kinase